MRISQRDPAVIDQPLAAKGKGVARFLNVAFVGQGTSAADDGLSDDLSDDLGHLQRVEQDQRL